MLDKLEALKTFCICAETLQFKETANRLAVSPPVVTRIIAELENELGEPLFQRNTRQILLTDFGQAFLPKAQQFLAHSEELFHSKKHSEQEMKGLVRIALPYLPFEKEILTALYQKLRDYPEIVLDWRVGEKRVNVTEAQIDIGLRIGVPQDSRLIVKKVGQMCERIVASPELVERCGTVRNLAQLQEQYPLIVNIDENTGRFWSWLINENEQFTPKNPAFIASDMYNAYHACQLGIGACHSLDVLCDKDLAEGKMVELLPELTKMQWAVYLYRPQRNVTPTRVKVVFELLEGIIKKHLA